MKKSLNPLTEKVLKYFQTNMIPDRHYTYRELLELLPNSMGKKRGTGNAIHSLWNRYFLERTRTTAGELVYRLSEPTEEQKGTLRQPRGIKATKTKALKAELPVYSGDAENAVTAITDLVAKNHSLENTLRSIRDQITEVLGDG